RVDPMPAQDMLIIDLDGTEAMVPFVKAIVPEVDLRAGRIVITPPPGLLEELDAPDDEPAGDEPAADDAVADDATAADASGDASPTFDEAEQADADDRA